MAHSLKTEPEEGSSEDLQQRTKEEKCKFRFCFDSNRDTTVFVSCNRSMTVLDALKESEIFIVNKNVNDIKKEIVILRANGAAVKTDFPCCLFEKDEIITITFIKTQKKDCAMQETQERPSRMDLVTFYIKTTGKEKMMHTMKNNALRNTAEYVCVYAFKGEDAETALEHDGRFTDKIFQKLCVLTLESKSRTRNDQSRFEMSSLVEHLDKKKFQIIVIGNERPDTQKKQTNIKIKSEVASAADSAQNYPGQHLISTEQKTVQERETHSPGPSAIGPATQNTSGNWSADSGKSFFTEIENFLRPLCEDVLKKLTRKNSPVQKFFLENYDKGVRCFTEVNKVRQITKLSNSVCLIKVEDCGQGTGFLVFDRFILTNAHVVKDCVCASPESPLKKKLSKTVTALFNYEVSGSAAKLLSVKDDIVAYGFEANDRQRFHDFALLELESAPDDCVELFERYKHVPPPDRGGIYIVGHPNGEVKKMDPCFIIGSENKPQSINKHISENVSCPYVTWQCLSLLNQNRITYDSCFFHGSSGSPVFDEHCCLIGMHSGGFHYKENSRDRSVIEFAYSMPSIINAIVGQVKTRSDILTLLSKFKSINEYFDLKPLGVTFGANVSVDEEQQMDEEQEMEVDP